MTGRPQRTIAREAELEGIGLHTGEPGRIRFKPAPPGTGVVFVRTDLPGQPRVHVRPENAYFDPSAGRRTILQENGVQVHTMEHILAAVAGLGIDNLVIETSTLEAPEPGDGSALQIAQVLAAAGPVAQDRAARHVKVTRRVHYRHDGAELCAEPYGGLRITFTIEYASPLIGTQTLSIEITPETFMKEIAPARTFVLERDLDALRKAGWIRGGRIESAVVVGEDRVLNQEPLRYPDEFVRHKILDLLGDLFLLGGPMLGHVVARRSGHQSHVGFVRKLRATLPLPGRRADRPADEWDVSAILDILPHRYPFLLVDRVTRLEEGSMIEGIKNVSINEPFFQGHFPGHPIMPAVLILESMAQLGGLLLLNSIENPSDKLMYFASIDNARFRRPVRPGDQMRIVAKLLKLRQGTSKLQGEVFVDDQLVAEAVLVAAVVERANT